MTGTSPLELSAVHAVEILDSRGGPTLAVTVTLTDGTTARAGVPSRSRIAWSTAAGSANERPTRASAISPFTLPTAVSTPLPP